MSEEPEVIAGEVVEAAPGPPETVTITLPDAIVERLKASAEEYAANELATLALEGPEYAGLAIYKVAEDGALRTTGTAFELDECPTCFAFTTTQNKVAHSDWHQRSGQTSVDAVNRIGELVLMIQGLNHQFQQIQQAQ